MLVCADRGGPRRHACTQLLVGATRKTRSLVLLVLLVPLAAGYGGPHELISSHHTAHATLLTIGVAARAPLQYAKCRPAAFVDGWRVDGSRGRNWGGHAHHPLLAAALCQERGPAAAACSSRCCTSSRSVSVHRPTPTSRRHESQQRARPSPARHTLRCRWGV